MAHRTGAGAAVESDPFARVWAVLSDTDLRRVYDTNGEEEPAAV